MPKLSGIEEIVAHHTNRFSQQPQQKFSIKERISLALVSLLVAGQIYEGGKSDSKLGIFARHETIDRNHKQAAEEILMLYTSLPEGTNIFTVKGQKVITSMETGFLIVTMRDTERGMANTFELHDDGQLVMRNALGMERYTLSFNEARFFRKLATLAHEGCFELSEEGAE